MGGECGCSLFDRVGEKLVIFCDILNVKGDRKEEVKNNLRLGVFGFLDLILCVGFSVGFVIWLIREGFYF